MDKTKTIIEKLKKISHIKRQNTKVFLNKVGIIKFIAVFFAGIFLTSNIFASQSLPFIFEKIINFDKNSTIIFLKKIKDTQFFTQQLQYFEEVYQQPLSKLVFYEENQQKQEIIKLKQILEKNPYARDVLYRLFQNYQQLADQKKAQQYLEKAKAIDPQL